MHLRHYLTAVFILSILLPPLMTSIYMFLTVGSLYRPTPLLFGLTLSQALPFALLYWLAVSDAADLERGVGERRLVVGRLAGAWLPMFLIAATVLMGVEMTTFHSSAGSSTNPVAVVTSPVLMFVAGMSGYAISWLGCSLIKLVRPSWFRSQRAR